MIIPDLGLFKTYIDNLARTIKWLHKVTGAPQAVIDLVIYDTAQKLSGGVVFSTTKCDCGCGMEGRNTAIEHYMAKEVKRLNDEAYMEVLKRTEDSIYNRITGYIEAQNAKFIEESTVKVPFFRRKYVFIPLACMFGVCFFLAVCAYLFGKVPIPWIKWAIL